MKRLIICADGTWNDEDRASAPTNVAKLHRALQTYHIEGVSQFVYYHSGVGTKWGERVRGGAFGYGINRNIRACYEFLVDHYERGDELYLFGFSRGAFTVRSLAGLIRNSGIVRDRKRVKQAFKLYRSRSPRRHPALAEALAFRRQYAKPAREGDGEPGKDEHELAYSPDIKFIGVWDTVGALGYPIPFFAALKPLLLALGINWWFHDTTLSRSVQHAYHALAIHERRSDFMPTLWQQQLDAQGRPGRSDQHMEQVWFAGVHSDVGGGYGASGLADVAFRWMVDKARACDLAFRERALEPGFDLAPDPLGAQHESFTGAFMLLDALRLRFRGRARRFRARPDARESIDDAVLARYRLMPAASWPGAGGASSFQHVLASLAAPGPKQLGPGADERSVRELSVQ